MPPQTPAEKAIIEIENLKEEIKLQNIEINDLKDQIEELKDQLIEYQERND